MIGGLTESAMGGNFFHGFATGAIVSGLNQALHDLADGPPNLPQEHPDERIYETPIRKDIAVIDPILMPSGISTIRSLVCWYCAWLTTD